MPSEGEVRSQLLVEGKDDLHVIFHLLRRHKVHCGGESPDACCIRECNGINGVVRQVRPSARSCDRLGVVVDANQQLAERWAQLQKCLEGAGVKLPKEPDRDGTVVEGITPDRRVGVWLMPDNSSKGALEQFVEKLVPQADPCWPYAGKATSHAKELGARFRDTDVLKVRMHTWLAWQEVPGRPFGTAITNRYFRDDSAEALRFVDWFRHLFGA